MSQRSEDDSPSPSSERLPLQDLVDAACTGIGGQPEQLEGFATRLLSCLRQYGSVDIIVQSMGVLQLVAAACELPPLKEDPEELLAMLHLLQEWAGQLPADQQRPFLRDSWLPLQRLFWRRLYASAAAGPAEAELRRLQSLADDAQKLLKAAWCMQGSEEAELAAASAEAAAALGQQQQQRQQQQQDLPPSSPTLEGCDALLGVPAGTLASKGFELVNAPLAPTFDRSLLSLLFFAAESLKLLGQWGRRPMAAFYPNSKAFDDPVWALFLRRCFRVASLLQWPALGGEAPPRMIEYFINLLWHEAQLQHWDTHTGQRVVETLEAEFTEPGAPRGLAVHLAGSAEAAPAAARLETGTRGRAVLGDTEGLSTGANVDGRKLEHAAGSGRKVVSVVTNRNDVQAGSIGSRLLERAFQQAQLCDLLSRQLAEIREGILAALPDRVRGVQLDGHGRPVSTRRVELVPAPAGHGWAQMGVQPPAADQPAAQAAVPAEASASLPALPRDEVEVSGSLEVPVFDDPSHQPWITREALLKSISAYQPCRDGPPPRLRQFHNSAASGSVGINRLKEESTELLGDAQFFAQAGFHNPVASAKASKAGQTVRLKPGHGDRLVIERAKTMFEKFGDSVDTTRERARAELQASDPRALAAAEAEFAERHGDKPNATTPAEDAYMLQHVGANPDIPVRRMAQLLYQHRPAGSVVCLAAGQYDRWRRRLRWQLHGFKKQSTALEAELAAARRRQDDLAAAEERQQRQQPADPEEISRRQAAWQASRAKPGPEGRLTTPEEEPILVGVLYNNASASPLQLVEALHAAGHTEAAMFCTGKQGRPAKRTKAELVAMAAGRKAPAPPQE
ncbi:hypothetical protein ABPG77_001859 [Micractinium sp. CCAP 211/92]